MRIGIIIALACVAAVATLAPDETIQDSSDRHRHPQQEVAQYQRKAQRLMQQVAALRRSLALAEQKAEDAAEAAAPELIRVAEARRQAAEEESKLETTKLQAEQSRLARVREEASLAQAQRESAEAAAEEARASAAEAAAAAEKARESAALASVQEGSARAQLHASKAAKEAAAAIARKHEAEAHVLTAQRLQLQANASEVSARAAERQAVIKELQARVEADREAVSRLGSQEQLEAARAAAATAVAEAARRDADEWVARLKAAEAQVEGSKVRLLALEQATRAEEARSEAVKAEARAAHAIAIGRSAEAEAEAARAVQAEAAAATEIARARSAEASLQAVRAQAEVQQEQQERQEEMASQRRQELLEAEQQRHHLAAVRDAERLKAEAKLQEDKAKLDRGMLRERARAEAEGRVWELEQTAEARAAERLEREAAETGRWKLALETVASQVGHAFNQLTGPMLIPTVSAVAALGGSLLVAYQATSIAGDQWKKWMARPTVVRESSAAEESWITWIADYGLTGALLHLSWSCIVALLRVATFGCLWRVGHGSCSVLFRCINGANTKIDAKPRQASGLKVSRRVLDGLVLERSTQSDVRAFCASVHNARIRRLPLRNCLLYGPPGTGKTLLARRLARECGLHFALVSGGDLAALRADGVEELSHLFRWAENLGASSGATDGIFGAIIAGLVGFICGKNAGMSAAREVVNALSGGGPYEYLLRATGLLKVKCTDNYSHANSRSGGVILFIDECEAFLGSRERTNIGPTASSGSNGALLSALLSLTGSQRHDFMLVLASNRPEDLDSAVTDRVDVALHMPLPGLAQRRQLLRQWWDVIIAPTATGAPRSVSGSSTADKGDQSTCWDPMTVLQQWGKDSAVKGGIKGESNNTPSVGAAAAAAGLSVDEGGRGVVKPTLRRVARVLIDDTVTQACLEEVAQGTAGFSGRQLRKLVASIVSDGESGRCGWATTETGQRLGLISAELVRTITSREQRKHENRVRAPERRNHGWKKHQRTAGGDVIPGHGAAEGRGAVRQASEGPPPLAQTTGSDTGPLPCGYDAQAARSKGSLGSPIQTAWG